MAPASTQPPSAWLPTSRKEVEARGWAQLDVILFSGDAYVDHPSFGTAVIGRILESMGLRVAIVPQPNWQDDLRDFKKLGAPRLFFGISGGCMDSMVNHYTARKRLRSNDAYTAGGQAGFRPDYAVSVYSRILRQIYPDTPIVLGGIEASLRRLTHFDYWQNRLLPGILHESGANLLVYGMGEKSIREIALRLNSGETIGALTNVPQTAYIHQSGPLPEGLTLHSYEACLHDRMLFARNFKTIEEESNKMQAARILEPHAQGTIVVEPPYLPWSEAETDASFDLPYTRLPHPRYKDKPIPAYEMIRYSINIHRGCFGGCSFCTISAHQGKFVVSRSPASVLREASEITKMPGFAGYISDVGGPSANMYRLHGKDTGLCARYRRPSCLFPSVCRNLDTDPRPLLELYRAVRALPGIKKAFVGSGIRYDLLLDPAGGGQHGGFRSEIHHTYFEELCLYHTSGRLKVAPEHTEEGVLRLMRKPSFDQFLILKKAFDQINHKHQTRMQLIPYLISSHPGCRQQDMQKLSQKIRTLRIPVEQVQDFTPTPMTLSSVMYYTGVDPYTLKPVFTATDLKEKERQKEQFFWQKRTNM